MKSEIKGGDDNASGMVEYERFDEVMVRTLLEHARDYRRDTEERVLRAFKAFDPDDKGYIEVEALRTLLTSRGDSFVQQEARGELGRMDRGLWARARVRAMCAPHYSSPPSRLCL